MSILVVGHKGFIGGSIFSSFSGAVGISSSDPLPINSFDVIINANGNSRKFWANQNPVEDFDASVRSAYKIAIAYPNARHVMISSLDAHKDHAYGRNKKLAEIILKEVCPNHVILRCSSVIGKGMKKGVLLDVLENRQVFVSRESRIQFITTSALSSVVVALANSAVVGTYNCGGHRGVTMEELAVTTGRKIGFTRGAETQMFDYDVADLDAICGLKKSIDYVEEIARQWR